MKGNNTREQTAARRWWKTLSGRFRPSRASGRRYRFLTEKMNDVVWTTDLELNTTYVSPSIEKVLGFTPRERMRQTRAEQMPPATWRLAEEKLKEELTHDGGRAPDRSVTLDLDYYHRDGSVHTLETSLSFIRDRQGRPCGVYGLARDVTDRKRVEEQIRERVKELQALYGLSRIIEREDLTLEELYREVPRILSESLRYPDIACARIVIGEDEFHSGNFAPSPGMESVPIRVHGSILGRIDIGYLEKRPEGADETFLREERELIEAIAQRIGRVTERKRAEAELLGSEARFRAIFNSTKDAILIETPEGRITDANRAACHLLGYRREELLQMEVSDLVPPEVVATLASRIRPETVAEGAYIETEELLRDGRRVPIEISNSLVRLGGEEMVVAILRDITERKKSEAVLRRQKEELEKLTGKLRDALELANRMTAKAEEASVAKSRFLANMSHEIRTPMNGVLGMAGLLLDSGLNEEQSHYAEIIQTSGETLLALINDILDFSKIEAGRLELERADFDLEKELEQFAGAFALPAEAKGLDFVCRVASDTPTLLKGDSGKLKQILNNLAGNAIKFTEQGSVTVEASLDRREEGRAVLVFTVADTGVGIPPRHLQGIFEPFTQADETTTRRYGGTGLGLAIARQLVEMMDGEISVESSPGGGSTFRFSACFELQSGPARLAPPPGLEDLVPCRGDRILVVDDNRVNRELMTSLLGRWGLRSGEAASGREALGQLRKAAAASDPYRAAVLDMMMPGMNGEELARKIKVDPDIPRLPLILMSSIGVQPDPARKKELVFTSVLTKPVNRSALVRALAAALRARPRPAPPAPGGDETGSAGKKSFRILVAEDNPVNQKVARRMLERLGYDTRVVSNGREALQALAEEPGDLVLMDIQMPVMDGFAAAREIRDPGSAVLDHRVPIIALTAHALQGDRERCLAAGMDDYLPKPITISALKTILEKWLEKV